jgi:chitinase
MWRLIVTSLMLSIPLFIHAAEPKVVGYFAEWSVYDRNYHVKDIPAARLTHLNYGFAKIVDGECTVFDPFAALEKEYPGGKDAKGNFNQLRLLKSRHPHLKTLISVGGWTLSGPFSDVALTAASRAKFAKSCVAFVRKHGFDGVDVDWEYPAGGGLQANKTRPEDTANYTLLLAELRKHLNAAGKDDGKGYLLTIAAPAGPRVIENLELGKLAGIIDWFNLMAYDFHGSWDERTNFNAPLFAAKEDPARDDLSRRLNVDAAVRAYLDAKVPAEKLVLGVPFFGRGWSGVKFANNGLYQPHKGLPKGTWEEGVFDYKDLAKNYAGKFARHWHDGAKVPWLFDLAKGVMISYDDPESMRLKGDYAREKKLGGVMCWELSADDAKGSLLGALREGMIGK